VLLQEKYTARAALGGQFMLNGRCAGMNGRILGAVILTGSRALARGLEPLKFTVPRY
jgi:hypothetical protein